MVQRKWLVEIKKSLSLADWATLLYALSTAIWIIIFFNKVETPLQKLFIRVVIASFILALAFLNNHKEIKFIDFLHHGYPIILLSYWYGETASLNSVIFVPFDQVMYNIDYWMFGYQPSLEFSANFSSNWFSEIINFSYFSYYFFNIITFLLIYFYNKSQAMRAIFIIITSFFIYYWIFILFPVVGPQFWFPEALRSVPDGYIFREGVKLVQFIGEKPTGAFPSSHVGMTIVFLILTLQTSKKSFLIMLPVSIILCFATVYIKAHYFIDVIAGLITGFAFYYFSDYLYKKINRN